MPANHEIKSFLSGVHNLFPAEVIPEDAASDEKNWYTQDGRIKLIPGSVLVGAQGTVGKITGEIFGYKINGDKIHWRKAGTKIQYFNGTSWVDTVTGLTETADYAFTNYSSLAGAFTFAFGIDGIFKMNNANPGSYNSMYNSAKNFKGYAFIDKSRSILWNRLEDKTGLYGSWIDAQNATVYTTVTGEATVSLGGTLAFKGGGATRNCFAVVIVVGGQTFTDNGLGALVGSAGGTGTINYISGVYTVSVAGVGAATYQWEDSNIKGVTDFTHASPRNPGEGFVFPQDEGGDPIVTVLIGQDGYYSIKSQSAYLLTISIDDTEADNNVYRRQLGVRSLRGAVSTSKGIIFMNTSAPEKPLMTILQRNNFGDAIEPVVLFSQFKFENYDFSDCAMFPFERYIVMACKRSGASNNDTILLCDVAAKTVDITSYTGRTFASDNSSLYMGSSLSMTVYHLFNGFDDDGFTIDNYWESRAETYPVSVLGISLKKFTNIRLKGRISQSQSYAIYIQLDDGGYQLVGTVLGTGAYVNANSPQTIGANIIGTVQIGGAGSGSNFVTVYPYFVEIKMGKMKRFRQRKVKFIALSAGYVDIEYQFDKNVLTYENKMPASYRLKQNVSLDGGQTDLPNPQY